MVKVLVLSANENTSGGIKGKLEAAGHSVDVMAPSPGNIGNIAEKVRTGGYAMVISSERAGTADVISAVRQAAPTSTKVVTIGDFEIDAARVMEQIGANTSHFSLLGRMAQK